jgi:hypothetical protein
LQRNFLIIARINRNFSGLQYQLSVLNWLLYDLMRKLKITIKRDKVNLANQKIDHGMLPLKWHIFSKHFLEKEKSYTITKIIKYAFFYCFLKH